METLIQHHSILLKDKVRMEAYRKAIIASVREGDTVLDIGCGLGILSFMALRAGASHVHAVEIEPNTLKLAKLLARHNGLDKQITFYKGLSTSLKLKKKVDLVVSELFGNLGLNENLLPVLIDARKRLLKDTGRIIPLKIKVWFAPCEYRDWEYTVNTIHNIEGFDFLPDSPEIDLGTPSTIIKTSEILANSKIFAELNLLNVKSDTVSNKMTFEILKDGLLCGFAGWFEAGLADTVLLSTTPSGLTTHWKQGFLPLRTPQNVRIGQKIDLELEIAPDRAGLNSIIGYHTEIR